MGDVRTAIEQLLGGGTGPITFLDALRLLRRVKQIDTEDLDALVQLHDNSRVTDGGKEVLGDLLRGKAQSMAQERVYSERVLRLDDSKRIVRATVGNRLKLLLDVRAHLGGEWKVQSINDDAMKFHGLGMDKDWRYMSCELELRRPGRYSVTLYEYLTPPLRSFSKSQTPAEDDKVFELDVIIEPK